MLKAKNVQLQDLEDLPSQLVSREEAEEAVRRELEEAQSQLVSVQHEAAMLRAKQSNLQQLEHELDQLKETEQENRQQVSIATA